MNSCFFYLNDSISPSIYSPSEILSTNPKIRILLDCQPTQFFYSKLLIENKKDIITPSINKTSRENINLKNVVSNQNKSKESHIDFHALQPQMPPIKQFEKPANKSKSQLSIQQKTESSGHTNQEYSSLEGHHSASLTTIPSNSSPSSISKFKKRSPLQSGDQISIYYKSELLGNGTFHSQGAHFFIWHDAEGNERFQVKDGLLSIKKG